MVTVRARERHALRRGPSLRAWREFWSLAHQLWVGFLLCPCAALNRSYAAGFELSSPGE